MPAEQRVVPVRVPRTAGERMLEVVAELDELSALLRRQGGHGHGSCRLAGVIAWRLLVVREMVWASPMQAALAAALVDAVERSLAAVLEAPGWGLCRDFDEALSDLATVLADVADAVVPESA